MPRTRTLVKEGLTRLGAACPLPALQGFNSACNYLWIGNWMVSRGFHIGQRVDSREQVFLIAAEELRAQEVLYLEFGVYRGKSMATWSRLLENPKSRLHGFDSFEGLPESWDLSLPKSHFSLGGAIPHSDDPRVSFFKGLFSETLSHYVLPSHERLFVNIDADLYSSTKTVLTYLKPHISIGTLLYFDEFQAREHESKAFDEFLSDTRWEFQLVAASRGLSHVLFRRTAP